MHIDRRVRRLLWSATRFDRVRENTGGPGKNVISFVGGQGRLGRGGMLRGGVGMRCVGTMVNSPQAGRRPRNSTGIGFVVIRIDREYGWL